MRTPSAESAHRLGELALLTTAFVLPLAFSLHSYDPASLKFAVLQWGSLAMLFGWLWQGISRGRFQAPAASWTVLLPVLAYGSWTAVGFVAEGHKLAALPDFLTRLTMLAAFLGAFLGFSGARYASRFAALTVASALLAAAGVACSRTFSAAAAPYLASLLAVAVPLALTLELDPETPGLLRAAALLMLPAAAVVLRASPAGAAGFCVSCVVYAAIVASALRTKPGLKSAGLALLTAAAVGGYVALTATAGRAGLINSTVPIEGGAAGAILMLWLFGAALWTGARAASSLRRAGALPESTYAAGFAAAAAGALAAAHFGPAGQAPAAGWYAWPLAGLAAGLAPLAARRAAVSVYPLPVSESVRRALYAPALLSFAALTVLPGLWLRSDVELNTAVYAARNGDLPRAVELLARAVPGARNYPLSLYYKGDALSGLARYDEALAAYGLLQEQSPDFARVHARRGAVYAKLGDWAAASSERARQAELDPLYLENLVAWSEAARAAGNLDEARLAAGKAEALDAGDERVRLQVAANGLMERRLAEKAGRGRPNGHGTARKPR